MRLEIVSHCWLYGRLLNYQLSSLVLSPPRHVELEITVYVGPADDDPWTREILGFFRPLLENLGIQANWRELDLPHLFRRAIGRNLSAISTQADWIWFADCDMCFGEGCLDSFLELEPTEDRKLLFPSRIWMHQTHALGDAAVERVDRPQVLALPNTDFKPGRYSRAIGGVQIVSGATAREFGYCRNTRFMRPCSGKQWQNTREDVAFRRTLRTRGVAATIPNVFRIRHSRRGQDMLNVRL